MGSRVSHLMLCIALISVGLSAQQWVMNSPPAISGASFVYDPVSQRMILFGGRNEIISFDQTWALKVTPFGPAWSELDVGEVRPPARFDFAAVYRPSENEMIIFGGRNYYEYFNDLWALELDPGGEHWEEISASGPSPAPRKQAAMVYDPVNDRLLLFGGALGDSNFSVNDLWSFDFSTGAWTELNPDPAPCARHAMRAVYDDGLMYVFGGADNEGNFLNDLWALSTELGNESWTQLSPSGDLPDPRSAYGSAFDLFGHNWIIHGGYYFDWDTGFVFYNDVYELNLPSLTWVDMTPSTGPYPPPARNTACVYEQNQHVFFAFGGDVYMGFQERLYSLVMPPTVIGESSGGLKLLPSLRVYPNPAAGLLNISYYLPEAGAAVISIYDVNGRRVKRIEKIGSAGLNTMSWKPLDEKGRPLPAGLYFARLEGSSESCKFEIIR